MSGATKLLTPGGGGVVISPASSIASDVTVNLPVTGVSGGTLVCSDSSGNVGIGTSSPAYKLHVVGTGYVSSYLTAGGIAADTSSALLFKSGAGTEAMRIDSSGNLLVGTTTASAPVTVVGAASSAVLSLDRTSNIDSTSRDMVQFRRATTSVGSITCSNTATAYNTSSDYRLKENVQPMQNALATVQQLNPVTYNWKADGSAGQGFIAHELQAVVPDCVTGQKDAVDADGKPVYQGIDTSFLVATLTAAIQEQQALITALTARVAALEAK